MAMQELKLQVSSEIVDGIEELWVTSDLTVIHMSIDVSNGVLRNFSCRLGSGVVAEMGEVRSALSGHVYPSLWIFIEDENHNTSHRQLCIKRGNEWVIES